MPRWAFSLNLMSRTIAIVQARSRSSRLPGKSLADIEGKPLIQHVIERSARASRVDEIVLATTVDSSDDELAAAVSALGYRCVRGSELDVLDRFALAAREAQADIIVRVTADDPLKDPAVIDRVIAEFHANHADYASNTIKPTFPEGVDIEVFSHAALENAWRNATLPSEREHVTPYIWSRPSEFCLVNVTHSEDLSSLRWTVDHPQDLEFVRSVYRHLYRVNPGFLMEDVLQLLRHEPSLAGINTGIARGEGYQRSIEIDARTGRSS
jgi:spore coat polysaccharide biosynthesis protein SpsF